MTTRFLRSILTVALIAVFAFPALAEDALSLVPANAVTVGMVKLGDLRTSPLSSVLFEHTDKMSTDGEAREFLAESGLSPTKDIDVLVVATSARSSLGTKADLLVIAEGRFNVEKLKNALMSRGAVISKGQYLVLHDSDNRDGEAGAIAFLSPAMIIGGTESAVAAALEARASGGTGFRARGALGLDLGRVDPNASAWALVDVTRAARLAGAGTINTGKGQSGDALQAALRSVSTLAVWAKDAGDALELGAVGLSTDAETLSLLEDTARGALSALRLAVKDKAPDMVSVLRRFDVSSGNGAVRVEGSIPASAIRDMLAKKRASN